ncbi:haloacid dehalogenase type II [Limnobacter sp.]|uniref:haloacid dehalogenase type II n=1 Tax=Limnobacter sp. TaxID=2003368 RepID=UPI0035157084
MSKVSVVLFDAYGTLFDVYAVGQTAESLFPGQGKALANLWRDRQIDYTRLRALSGQYKAFWNITQDALEYACEALGLPLSEQARRALLEVYSRLPAYDECAQVLEALRAKGIRTGILSNGDPAMLSKAIESAGLGHHLDAVLSADALQTFKTNPAVYQYGLDQMGVGSEQTLFVSSNGWDVCGASWFGLRTFWVNRAKLPRERLDIAPTHEGSNLLGVMDLL